MAKKITSVKIPQTLFRDTQICDKAKLLWGLIHMHEHNAVGGCFCSLKWLASKIGVRYHEAKTLAINLQSSGWLEKLNHPASIDIFRVLDPTNSPKSKYHTLFTESVVNNNQTN